MIDRNTSRKPKRLWSDAGAGEQIVGYVADTEHAEADWVGREVDRLVDAGETRPGDIAVFYRTNAQSRVFEEVFIRVGLPYKVVGGGALLRAQGGPRRAGLPARGGQRRRHGQPSAGC
ncbi:hypothetical protein TPA0907_02710 [Micromonospora humidisoli]|nr:hypothetical protein TPA0907_02710 [Micromonospora sp. AKA109]